MRLVARVLVAAMLIMPIAGATPGVAEVLAQGTVTVTDAVATTSPIAMFSPSGGGWQGATLRCDTLHVVRFERTYASAQGVETPIRDRQWSYTLTNVTAFVRDAERDAWTGIYPAPGLAMGWHDPSPVTVSAALDGVVGNAPSTAETDVTPDEPSFGWTVKGASVLSNSSVSFALDGPLMLKVRGIAFDIRAAENESTLDTRTPIMPAPTSVRRWAFLECAEGSLETCAPVHVLVASRSLQLAQMSRLATVATRALVTAGEGAPLTTAGTFYVQGQLKGTLDAVAQGASASTRISLTGDITSSSVAPAGQANLSVLSASLLLAGLAVVVGGGTLVAVRRHRTPPTLEGFLDQAASHAEAGDYASAVAWTDRALALSPQDPRLLAEKGYYLGEIGEVAAALRCFRAAAAAGSADAPLMLARLACRLDGGDLDEAAQVICAALEGAPSRAPDIEADPGLARLRARPEVRRALRQAFARLRG